MQTIVVEPDAWGPARQATIEIPAGWYRVLSGAVKPGDHALAESLFWQTGEIQWYALTEFPRANEFFGEASWYGCLIRRGEPVEGLCPRCHCEPVRLGYRYCRGCCADVVDDLRER